jgi:hypothetical protein
VTATARRQQCTSEPTLAAPIGPPARLTASVPTRTGQPTTLVERQLQVHALTVADLIRGRTPRAGAATTISRLAAGHRGQETQP